MSEVREASTVVTGETLAAFQAQRLGLSDTPPEAKPEVDGEDGDKEPPEAQDEPPKPKKKAFNERISEVTAQRRAAEEKAQREETRALAAEKERDELRAKLAPPKVEEDPTRPKPADFKDAFEYAEALSDWKVAQKFEEKEKATELAKRQEKHDKVVNSWKEKAEAIKTELPDYETVVKASKTQVSDAVRDALMESDFGPRLLYEIATDPELAGKLEAKPGLSQEDQAALARQQLRLIGRLETKYDKEPEPEPVVAKERPKAPAPITPIRGSRAADTPVDSDGRVTGTFSQYKAARLAGKIK